MNTGILLLDGEEQMAGREEAGGVNSWQKL